MIFFKEGGVFYADDGYSFKSAKEGTAYIHGWKIAKQQIVFGSEERVGPGLTHASAQRISCAFDLTNYLVSVQVCSILTLRLKSYVNSKIMLLYVGLT